MIYRILVGTRACLELVHPGFPKFSLKLGFVKLWIPGVFSPGVFSSERTSTSGAAFLSNKYTVVPTQVDGGTA